MISIIAAYDRNRLIGIDDNLPWNLPKDLAYFKEKTLGKVVIQGRKTFESFKKPLANRTNVILTSKSNYKAEGCYVYNSVKDILNKHSNLEEVFVIGGSQIYKEFLPYADRLYITEIDYEFEGNVFFPEVDMSKWTLFSNTKGIKDDKNSYDYYFKMYERNIN
ncbi:dihydrofolate reductase [Brevibacillus brevis X23]|nr:dihydrofolate reductase [Brevibacillus brevis X23]